MHEPEAIEHGAEPPAEESAERVVQLSVGRIGPNPAQPRRRFDRERIAELAQSIRGQGVIQPIIVRRRPGERGGYELVAGERRLRAVRLLGWAKVPALVRDIADEDLLEAALVENLQREPLTPLEEAQAYRDLLDRFGYTQAGLARRVGKERSTVANMVRLLGLPLPLQRDLEQGRLSVGHARALLPLEDAGRQTALRDAVLRGGLTVRETERLVRKTLRPGALAEVDEHDTVRPGRRTLEPEYQAVQDALERRFATRVSIRQRRHRGKVELEFYSLDDFNRIYDLLTGRES